MTSNYKVIAEPTVSQGSSLVATSPRISDIPAAIPSVRRRFLNCAASPLVTEVAEEVDIMDDDVLEFVAFACKVDGVLPLLRPRASLNVLMTMTSTAWRQASNRGKT